MRHRPTIRDVAELAGVSISTVSHAFSGARPISRQTRDRVSAAARTLGYNPNPSARALRIGRSGLIGLVLRPRFAVTGGPGRVETYNRLLGAVTTEVLRAGIGVVHVPTLDQPDLQPLPMDACIVAHPYRNDEVLSALRARGVPTVAIEEDVLHDDYPWVVKLDYDTAVASLLDELAPAEPQDTLFITGSEENAWNHRCRERFKHWCHQAGQEAWIQVISEGLPLADARDRLHDILRGSDRPRALVIHVSDYASLAVDVAVELGLSVPQDLQIAALSDTESSRSASIPVTAMDLRHEQLAIEAVSLAMQYLPGLEAPTVPRLVTPLLHRRASTLPASQRT